MKEINVAKARIGAIKTAAVRAKPSSHAGRFKRARIHSSATLMRLCAGKGK